MSYREPMLIELYAEWHLAPGSFPPERLFDVVPLIKESGFSEVEFGTVDTIQIVIPSGAPQIEGTASPRVRCWSPDRSRLVQLGPDLLVTNLVNPAGGYPGWNRFLETVAKPSLTALRHKVPSASVVSVSLTAIDRMSVKKDALFNVGSYLNCSGKGLPTWCASIREGCDVRIGRGVMQVDGFNRQVQIVGRPTNGEYILQMHSIFHDAVRSGQNEIATLNKLHDEANEWFESVITDRTRNEVMKGTLDVTVHR